MNMVLKQLNNGLKRKFVIIILVFFLSVSNVVAFENTKITGIGDANVETDVKLECLNCHATITPKVVNEWKESKHGTDNVKCYICHGTHEKSFNSTDFVAKPQKERCRACHAYQVETLSTSKMKYISCGTCHKVHQFSSKIASEIKTCANCHKTQHEIFEGSTMQKIGVKCSDCHFHEKYLGVSSHSLKIDEKSCEVCHKTTKTDKLTQLSAIQTEISSLLSKAKEEGAQNNGISTVEKDGSKGAHNPVKAKQLIGTFGIKEEQKNEISGLTLIGINVILLSIFLILMYLRGRDKK